MLVAGHRTSAAARPTPASSRPTPRSCLLLLALGVITAGCGGSTPGSSGTSTPTTCTITFSGAVSQTSTCTVTSAWASSTNTSAVAITSPAGARYVAELSVGWIGPMSTGTYRETDASARTAMTLTDETSHDVWIAAAGSSTTQGSYALTLTSIGAAVTGSTGTGYVGSHGTLQATLPAVAASGASGSVTVQATF